MREIRTSGSVGARGQRPGLPDNQLRRIRESGFLQAAAAPPPRREAAETLQSEPLTSDLRRLHVTVSKRFIDKLESARAGQSHAQPDATAEQVLEAALDLLLAHQARRRGAATTPRKAARPAKPDHVPAAVRRAVWARDQSRCTWPLAAGGTCDSTLRLEIDHVVPRARGGAPTVSNLRILCAVHNALAARQVYGDAWMDRFTGRAGEGKPGQVPVAREPAAAWGWLPHPFEADEIGELALARLLEIVGEAAGKVSPASGVRAITVTAHHSRCRAIGNKHPIEDCLAFHNCRARAEVEDVPVTTMFEPR